jgi:hypothetical protein
MASDEGEHLVVPVEIEHASVAAAVGLTAASSFWRAASASFSHFASFP